jgi:hypothetical protein
MPSLALKTVFRGYDSMIGPLLRMHEILGSLPCTKNKTKHTLCSENLEGSGLLEPLCSACC